VESPRERPRRFRVWAPHDEPRRLDRFPVFNLLGNGRRVGDTFTGWQHELRIVEIERNLDRETCRTEGSFVSPEAQGAIFHSPDERHLVIVLVALVE
jgi:hypothetical protein